MNRQLNVEVTHKYSDTTLSNMEFKNLLDIVRWKEEPFFAQRGRMAWHVFDKTIYLKNSNDIQLNAAKIKGVGGFNPPNGAKNRDPIYSRTTEKPFQPTNLPLLSFASYPHFGFDQHGNFNLVLGDVAPIGGILYRRALAEFECAQHLLQNGIPSIVPLAVVKYGSELNFNGQEMGATICLSPSRHPFRLSEIQTGAALRTGENSVRDIYYSQLLRSFKIEGDPSLEVTRLTLMAAIAPKVGKLIHDFSKCGLYRYSAELSNFEFDFSRCEVVLTDLDSSHFLSYLPLPIRRLQVLRDMASMVYHFLAKFASPLALGHFSLSKLLKYDPLGKLIGGYFPGSSKEEIGCISRKLWNCFIPYFMLLNRHADKILNEWTTERRRSYKMDHDLFYTLAITCLYPLFCESDLNEQYPNSKLTVSELIRRSKEFLGNRFEYYDYLLNYDKSIPNNFEI